MVLNLNISLLVTFGYFWSCGPQFQKYTFGGGICRIYFTLYEKWPKVKYSGSKPFLDMADNNRKKLNILYIYLNQKYTFGLVIHMTKSNLKWPKVKYSCLKPYIDIADDNHIKLNIFYIYLHQKYAFGLVVYKTKSNQKWPKVKYLGSKLFLNMADDNHK